LLELALAALERQGAGPSRLIDLATLPADALLGRREDRDVAEGYRIGANSYICKPVDFEKFTEAIGRLGMYWVLLNEPPLAIETGH